MMSASPTSSSAEGLKWSRQFSTKLWTNQLELTMFASALTKELKEHCPGQEELNQLSIEILRMSTITCSPNKRLFDCLKLMVHTKNISWSTFLKCVIRFDHFQKSKCVKMLAEYLMEIVDVISCPYNDSDQRTELSNEIINLFTWLSNGIDKCINDLDMVDSLDALLDCSICYSKNTFIKFILRIHAAHQPDEISSMIVGPIAELYTKHNENSKLQELMEELQSVFSLIVYHPELAIPNFMHETRSGIRTVAVVFACFRVLQKIEEVMGTLHLFSAVLGITIKEALMDVIHVALLMHLEDGEIKSPFVEMFLFLKLPKLMQTIQKEQLWSIQDVEDILQTVFQHSRQVLEGLETTNREWSLRIFLEQMYAAKVITHDFLELASKPRLDIPRRQTFFRNEQERQHTILVLSACNAKSTAEKVLHNSADLVQYHNKLLPMLCMLMGSGGYAFDAFCATYCVDGNLTDMSMKLASLNQTTECPINGLPSDIRLMTFDITFCMLSRVASVFVNVSPSELVNGRSCENNTTGVYFQWMQLFARRIGHTWNQNPPTSEEKVMARESLQCLKEGRLYWDTNTANYREIVFAIPAICDCLLDEFKSRNHSLTDVSRVVTTLRSATFLIVCMLQWLDAQPQSDVKSHLSRAIKEAMEQFHPAAADEKTRWLFTRMTCRRIVDEMVTGKTVVDSMTYTLLTMAKRTLPTLTALQIPEKEMLKKGWLFGQRQNWCSQPVLLMLDHCNRGGQHKVWVEIWLHNLLKLRTCDDMCLANQIIYSAAFLDPARSLLAICQILVDYVLDPESIRECRYEPSHAIPLAQLLSHVLILSVWTMDTVRRRDKEWLLYAQTDEPPEKRNKIMDEAVPQPLPEGELSVIKELDETIDVTINKLNKEVQSGLLTQEVSFVCHVIQQIASVQPVIGSEHENVMKMLRQKIPHTLLFNLAVLEPLSIPFELFSVFCEDGNAVHDEEKMKFLVLMRNHSVL